MFPSGRRNCLGRIHWPTRGRQGRRGGQQRCVNSDAYLFGRHAGEHWELLVRSWLYRSFISEAGWRLGKST